MHISQWLNLSTLLAQTPVRPPFLQVPGIYRQLIGTLRITALFDGSVTLPRQHLTGIAPSAVARLLDHRYVPEDATGLQTAVNAYLVQRGSRLVLVDTGGGHCLGPGLGQVLTHLRAAGYAPQQVDDVLLTHAHTDHMCGLLDDRGRPAYPNAVVWLSRTDADYWLDPASEAIAPQMLKFAFALARQAAAPYQRMGRLKLFTPGESLPVGASALDSHGHTPGHVSYLFEDGSAQLLVWGDIVHYHAVQFAQPDAAFEADSDRAAALAARRRLMQRAADAGGWVAGAHLPFPGLGHVRHQGDAFAWVPTEFAPLSTAD